MCQFHYNFAAVCCCHTVVIIRNYYGFVIGKTNFLPLEVNLR